MASMDYCYWRGERCRYVGSDTEWDCEFHRALQAGDIEVMQRALLNPSSGRMPAGLAFESVERRDDGSFAFMIVALPNDEHDHHPLVEAAVRGLSTRKEERATRLVR